MEKILAMLASEQAELQEKIGTVTIVLATGEKVTGVVESTQDDVVSITRQLRGEEYADIPRHYAISAVIGAYYTEGS